MITDRRQFEPLDVESAPGYGSLPSTAVNVQDGDGRVKVNRKVLAAVLLAVSVVAVSAGSFLHNRESKGVVLSNEMKASERLDIPRNQVRLENQPSVMADHLPPPPPPPPCDFVTPGRVHLRCCEEYCHKRRLPKHRPACVLKCKSKKGILITASPTTAPTKNPSVSPTISPTLSPTSEPTWSPTPSPTECPTYHVNSTEIDLSSSPCNDASAHCVQTNFAPSEGTPFVTGESGWVFSNNGGYWCHEFVMSASCPDPELSVEQFELDNESGGSESTWIYLEESDGTCPQLAQCDLEGAYAVGQCGGYWETCLNSKALTSTTGASTFKLVIQSGTGSGFCSEEICGYTYYHYLRFNLICRGLVSDTPADFPPPLPCRNSNPFEQKNAAVDSDVSGVVELFGAHVQPPNDFHASWCYEVVVRGSKTATFQFYNWNFHTESEAPRYRLFDGRTNTTAAYSVLCPTVSTCVNDDWLECGSVTVSAGIYRVTFDKYFQNEPASCTKVVDIDGTDSTVNAYNKITIST